MMIFAVLGILSSIIFVLGDIPYLRDTITAKTKPHRVTWGMATLLNVVGFANQYASGARNSLWLFAAGAVMTGAIFIVSLRTGVGGYAKLDIVCLGICLAGLISWGIIGTPWVSILGNLAVDVTILVPTYIKARKHPESETRISWLVGTISVLLAAISVGKLDIQLLILPVASFFLQAYMVYILYIAARRKELA